MSYYVVIEGPDGSGKTDVTQMVTNAMIQANVATQLIREPGGTVFGEGLRSFILQDPRSRDSPPYAQALLFAAASYANSKLRHLPKTLMVTDRWAPISSRIYQTLFATTEDERHHIAEFWAHYVTVLKQSPPPGVPRRPDLIVYLKTSPAVAWSRRRKAGTETDNMDRQIPEDTEKRIRLYDDFLLLRGMYGIPRVVISTDEIDQTEVTSRVIDAILASLTDEEARELNLNARRVEL